MQVQRQPPVGMAPATSGAGEVQRLTAENHVLRQRLGEQERLLHALSQVLHAYRQPSALLADTPVSSLASASAAPAFAAALASASISTTIAPPASQVLPGRAPAMLSAPPSASPALAALANALAPPAAVPAASLALLPGKAAAGGVWERDTPRARVLAAVRSPPVLRLSSLSAKELRAVGQAALELMPHMVDLQLPAAPSGGAAQFSFGPLAQDVLALRVMRTVEQPYAAVKEVLWGSWCSTAIVKIMAPHESQLFVLQQADPDCLLALKRTPEAPAKEICYVAARKEREGLSCVSVQSVHMPDLPVAEGHARSSSTLGCVARAAGPPRCSRLR